MCFLYLDSAAGLLSTSSPPNRPRMAVSTVGGIIEDETMPLGATASTEHDPVLALGRFGTGGRTVHLSYRKGELKPSPPVPQPATAAMGWVPADQTSLVTPMEITRSLSQSSASTPIPVRDLMYSRIYFHVVCLRVQCVYTGGR